MLEGIPNTIKVGPDGSGSYRYMIDGYMSFHYYANSASAWHDARRLQRILPGGFVEPSGFEQTCPCMDGHPGHSNQCQSPSIHHHMVTSEPE